MSEIASDDYELKVEIMHMLSAKNTRKMTRDRWDLIYRMYHEGKSIKEIAEWIDRSESTVIRLLKRAALEKQKQPGYVWPVGNNGKRLCTVSNPMPLGNHANDWEHPNGYPLKPRGIVKTTPTRGYCPICRHSYAISRTLCEVFAAEKSGS